MSQGDGFIRRLCRYRVIQLARKLEQDRSGTTAIEFAMVGLPFFMFLFGIFGLGLYFFTTFSLENAVDQASRLIRVGMVQQSGMTATEFKQEVCKHLPPFVDCSDKMRVNVQNYSDFGSIAAPSCTDSEGNLVPPDSTTYKTGASSEIVLVTVCYQWDLAGALPFLKLGDMPNGAALIQASATFLTEPYEE